MGNISNHNIKIKNQPKHYLLLINENISQHTSTLSKAKLKDKNWSVKVKQNRNVFQS